MGPKIEHFFLNKLATREKINHNFHCMSFNYLAIFYNLIKILKNPKLKQVQLFQHKCGHVETYSNAVRSMPSIVGVKLDEQKFGPNLPYKFKKITAL
jgi:hypothetical protein